MLAVPSLPVVIVRPALVYGRCDVGAIMPRAVVAAVYMRLKEKMQFLWDADMRINTVRACARGSVRLCMPLYYQPISKMVSVGCIFVTGTCGGCMPSAMVSASICTSLRLTRAAFYF